MKPLLITFFLIVSLCSAAQDFSKAMNNAFLITRMAEKFHVQPRPLNNDLSKDLFRLFINKTDPDRIIFLAEDIKQLADYEYSLDEEIGLRKTGFLQLTASILQKRRKQNDSLAQIICKTAFNFSLPEKMNVADDSSYATSIASKQKKIYLYLKWTILDFITDESERLLKLSSAKEKQVVDSTELVLRNQLKLAFKKAYEQSLNNEKAVTGTGNIFCKSLALCYDPHTEFMPLDEKEEFDEELGQKPLRFGFQLDKNESGDVIIGKLLPGSPAFKNGVIKPGDKILTIQENGLPAINIADYNFDQVDSVFNTIKSDKLFLTVKKPDGTTRQTFLLKERFASEEDEEDKVQGYVLKGVKNIGYISVPDFYLDWDNTETGIHGCANDVAKEIIKLKKENIEGLIIDIRYNGGGSLQEAIDLSGIFIDGGPVAQVKSKEAKVVTLKDVNSGTVFTGPMVIMVNGYSASASEMFSATMQDYNRAFIAGTPTYGKATGQIIFPLDTTATEQTADKKKADAYLKITTFALYRVTGTTAQQHGVTPDIILPDLLQGFGEKEKNEDFSFHLLPIEKNKYYKPYNVLNFSQVKPLAQSFVDTSSYFIMLKNYETWYKQADEQKEFSLKLDDVLQFKKKQQEYLDFFEKFTQHTSFTIENDRMQNERLKASTLLTEMDEETKKLLLNDPYVNICYMLLVKTLQP